MPRISEFYPELNENIKKEIEVPANLAELGLTHEDTELIDYLKNKSIDAVSKNEENPERTVVTFSHQQQIPHPLPQGWFFKGGAARFYVLKDMGEKVLTPCDWDFVHLAQSENEEPDYDQLPEISKNYLIDATDYETIPSYFGSRDFIINELCLNQDSVFATVGALRDLSKKEVRWTDYPGNPDRLEIRSIRLEAEFRAMYGKENARDWRIQYGPCDPFLVAVYFQKALQLGDDVAAKFYLILLEQGIIAIESNDFDSGSASVKELAVSLDYHLGSRFDEGEETSEKLDLIKSQSDDDEYEKLAQKYYIPGPVAKEFHNS